MPKTPYDEMYLREGAGRAHYLRYAQWLTGQPADRLAQKRAEADALFHRVGITFAVYGEDEGLERLIPLHGGAVAPPQVVPAVAAGAATVLPFSWPVTPTQTMSPATHWRRS